MPTKPRSGAYAPKSRLREMAEARPATATRVWKCANLRVEWKPTGTYTDYVGRGPPHAPRPRASVLHVVCYVLGACGKQHNYAGSPGAKDNCGQIQ